MTKVTQSYGSHNTSATVKDGVLVGVTVWVSGADATKTTRFGYDK